MGNIHRLPMHLVNKIAAGEVIERPASVVKELVENALDAGAARIDVRVEDGGRKSISVTDDGGGMSADDLLLAFCQHATSKIAGDEDLFRIETMGFRGEALASISAISHAHIRTRRPADEGGYEIAASGETIEDVRPCAAAGGTTVTVRDLFFNTPARRKFMRTANTEFGHVTEQFARLAIPHPQVAFTLTHNGREVQNLPASRSTASRVADFFGRDLAESLLPIVERGSEARVGGLVAQPAAARASSKWQYFFLNGRYIRDRVLSHALREAYRGLIEPSRWPVAMIFIEIDPAEVDVNVHPTKIEVRFRNSQLVHGELLAALKETLNRTNLAPKAELGAPAGPEKPQADFPDAGADERRESLRSALADFFRSAPSPEPRLGFPEVRGTYAPTGGPRGSASSFAPAEPFAKPQAPGRTACGLAEREASVPVPSIAVEEARLLSGDTCTAAPVAARPAAHRGAIQIHDSYIVAPDGDGLIVVDQHALHERILYNELKRRLSESPLPSQRLLIPETFAATAGEADALERHGELLARLGIDVAPFGPQTMAVQGFPTLLTGRGVTPPKFMRELVDLLNEDTSTPVERLLEDVLAMMACKSAVKAGDPLTPDEIDDLLARREEAEKASSCPHGRPTTLRLSLRDLEKQFKRT